MSLADKSRRNQQANREKLNQQSKTGDIASRAVDAYFSAPPVGGEGSNRTTKDAYDFSLTQSGNNSRPAYDPEARRVSDKRKKQEQDRGGDVVYGISGTSRAESALPEDDETGGPLYRKLSKIGIITLEKPVVLYPGSFEGIEQESFSQARFKFRFKVSPVPTKNPLVVTINFFQTPLPPEEDPFGNAPQDPIDPDTGLPPNPVGRAITVTIPAVKGEDLEKYPAGIYSEWIESSAYTKDPVTPTDWTVTIGEATGGGFKRIIRNSRATFQVRPYKAVAKLTSAAVWEYSGDEWSINPKPEDWELDPEFPPRWYWKGQAKSNWNWNPTKEDWEWTGGELVYPQNIPSELPPPTPNRSFPFGDPSEYLTVVVRGAVDKPVAVRVGASDQLKLKIEEEYYNSNNIQTVTEVGQIVIPEADIDNGPWRFVLVSNGWAYKGSSNDWFWHTQEGQWLYSGERAGEWQWKLVDSGPNGYQDGWTWKGPGYTGKEWDWATQSWKDKEEPAEPEEPNPDEPPDQPVPQTLPSPPNLIRPPVTRPPILPPYLGRFDEAGGVGKLTFFVNINDAGYPESGISEELIDELSTRSAKIKSGEGGGYSSLELAGAVEYKVPIKLRRLAVSICDEDSGYLGSGNKQQHWNEFVSTRPNDPFVLFIPVGDQGIVLPSGYTGLSFSVARGGGTDYYSLIKDRIRLVGIGEALIAVDNSGSMTREDVETDLNQFKNKLLQIGISVTEVSFSSEGWIEPHLQARQA